MKKLLFICSISFLLAFTFSSCKKDYPKDTPYWIQSQIKSCKRKACCYFYGGALFIDEWKNNVQPDSIIYRYYMGENPTSYNFYDRNGNLINKQFSEGDSWMANIVMKEKFTRYRLIWAENGKRCNNND